MDLVSVIRVGEYGSCGSEKRRAEELAVLAREMELVKTVEKTDQSLGHACFDGGECYMFPYPK
jgi:hypothetical protein